ncbi:putative benzoate 4-monooxygenase cytochrome P450 [Paraphoma chrysanthemicola]|uniref:Benzoate 4-monooxygenase cytochrome P450 n=1 Tax=Paraphoma chrysanthemicola TaxID=798071 RepID=A0A8K0RA55_9PLEO|nr:putative benzoate 4-monooxygenase cytochrome P450 [Paraphoma chrysanthemicola]
MLFSLSLLLAFAACIRTSQLLYRRFFHLRNFKGPWLATYTRLWLAQTYSTERANDIFLGLNKTYGKFARIGPNHLLTDDPEVHWRVLAPHSKYVRSSWFDSLRLDPHFASIASETDTAKHDALRSKVSAGYMTRNFPDLEPLIDREIAAWSQRLNPKLREKGEAGATFDFARSVRTLTLEIAAYICYSRSLDLKDNDQHATAFWESIEEAAPYGQYLSTFAWLFRLLYYVACVPWLKARLLLVEGNNPGIGHILKYSRITIEERFKSGGKEVNDMLGSWIQHGLSQHEVETEASIAIVTGAFPSASAINVLALHITTNPHILNTLRAEFRSARDNGTIGDVPSYAELLKLPYLQACIDEGLRLVPPIIQLRERLVPPEGDEIDGVHLPGGTAIGFNTLALLRHECFGSQPEKYHPERWLEANDDIKRLKMMRKIHGLIYGYGSTKCLGVTQANMIVYKFVYEASFGNPFIASC